MGNPCCTSELHKTGLEIHVLGKSRWKDLLSYSQINSTVGFYKRTSCSILGPVVQSIVSLTSSLRGQLIKCFMTL